MVGSVYYGETASADTSGQIVKARCLYSRSPAAYTGPATPLAK